MHLTFMDYVKQGWEVAKLQQEAIRRLADDKDAIGPAIGILAIGGVCAGIGSFSLSGMFILPVVRIIGAFIFTALIHFIVTSFFGGKGQFTNLAIPVFCSTVISWATIIPFIGPFLLGPLTGLWLLVVMVLSTEVVYGVDRGKAVAAVAIPLVLFLIVFGFIALIAGVGFMAMTGRLCI